MKRWTQLLSQFLTVIRRCGWALLILSILSNYGEQGLTHLMENELSSMEGASPWVWLYGAASVGISVLSPVIMSILVIAALLPSTVTASLQQHAQYVCKETLRAAGKSLSWGLLLVIPGLIRFLQFSFVPFVVMLDPEYDRGQKDALQESTRLVHRRFFKVTGILILFSILLPLLLTGLDEYSAFDQHVFPALLLAGLDAVISIFAILMLLNQWEKSHGTHVQLETN